MELLSFEEAGLISAILKLPYRRPLPSAHTP